MAGPDPLLKGPSGPKRPSEDSSAFRTSVEPRGRELAAFRRGEREGLRVSLDEYRGRPYVSPRAWALLDDGRWVPTRKGVSVRMGEIEGLAGALLDYLEGNGA